MDWTDLTTIALDAFDTLKSRWMEPLSLALPQPHVPYLIDTNASVHALGAVFLQQKSDSNLNEWVMVGS